jgi:hypothetical protein
MYYRILLLFLFTKVIICHGQSLPDTTLPRFAIASIPAINAGGNDDCWLYYSNGHKEDLRTILSLDHQKGFYNTQANLIIVTAYEFRTLEYMRNKGYELLSVYYDKGGHNRFYFEHK